MPYNTLYLRHENITARILRSLREWIIIYHALSTRRSACNICHISQRNSNTLATKPNTFSTQHILDFLPLRALLAMSIFAVSSVLAYGTGRPTWKVPPSRNLRHWTPTVFTINHIVEKKQFRRFYLGRSHDKYSANVYCVIYVPFPVSIMLWCIEVIRLT